MNTIYKVPAEQIEMARLKNQTFTIPKPLSRPLGIYYTRQDAEYAFKRLVECYEQCGQEAESLDWQRIRNMSGDSISTLIDILKRHIAEMEAL